MIECYDWEDNRIYLKDTYNNIFDIKLRGDKVIVRGNSGTGKTLLYNAIDVIQRNKNKMSKYAASNIILINEQNIRNIKDYENKLIIIDRGDIIINEEVTDVINSDFGTNRYLVFVRKYVGIELSPNYYANMVNDKKTLRLNYLFNVKGWF